MSKVLFIGDLDESLPEFQEFSKSHEILRYKLTTKEELLEKLANEFSSINAIYAGWLGFMSIGGLTSDIIDKLPSSLKVISITSVGYDSYDVSALKAKGIQLFNTPSLGAEAVADTILWHVLESFRNFSLFQKYTNEFKDTVKARNHLHSNEWDFSNGKVEGNLNNFKKEYPFGEISGRGRFVTSPIGKNVGFVGFGKIGKATGKRLSSIGMNIKYYKTIELYREEELELHYKVEFFEKLIDMVKVCDVVILTLPCNAKTKGIINKEILDNVKKGCKLINVGRGILIEDEDYLISKLQSGDLSSYGTDVFTGEPSINPNLFRDDITLTPHIGSSTKENFDSTAIFSLNNIEKVLNGEEGESRVV